MKEAVEELYEIRKREKVGLGKKTKTEPTLRLALLKIPKYENWKCPRCLRMNSPKTKFCTKCGLERD